VTIGFLSRLSYLPFKIDDFFIYAKYASNFAHGLGLVFNEGERVLAITSPLYTFLLSGVIRIVSDPVLAANILSLLLFIIALIIVWNLCSAIFQDRRAVILASLIFALGDVSNRWWMSGMETPLYVTLALSCLLAATKGKSVLAWFTAGLAILGRPDGILLIPLLIFSEWSRSRDKTSDYSSGHNWLHPFKLIAALLAPIIPWLIFSWLYYNTSLQSSVASKLNLDASTYGTFHFLLQSYQLNLKGYAASFFFLMPALLAVFFFLKKKNINGILLSAWAVGQILGYLVLLRPIGYWHLAPGFMGIYLLAGQGIILAEDILIKTEARQTPAGELKKQEAGKGLTKLKPWQRFPYSLSVIVIIYAILFNAVFAIISRKNSKDLWNGYGYIAECIREASSPDALIAAGDVGLLGVVSKRRILDFGGLLQPEVLTAYRNRTLDRFVLDQEPEFVILSSEHMTTEPFRQIFESQGFEKHYQEFMRREAFSRDYVVFQRIPSKQED
jgi:hypothetical protein